MSPTRKLSTARKIWSLLRLAERRSAVMLLGLMFIGMELVESFHQFDKFKRPTVNFKAFAEKGLHLLATRLKNPQSNSPDHTGAPPPLSARLASKLSSPTIRASSA